MPIIVVTSGILFFSQNWRTHSSPFPRITPPPAQIRGFFALLIAATLKLIPYSIKNNFGWFILAFSLLGIYFFSLDIAIIVLLASALGYCATKYLGSDTK